MKNIIRFQYIIIISTIAFFNVNSAILVFGTEEYNEAYLEHYVEVSDIIVLGEVYSKNFGTNIKVKKVLKGDKKRVGNDVVIFEFNKNTDVTCGVGEPSIPKPTKTAIAMFVLDKNKLNSPPIFINSYIKQKNIKKITKSLKDL